MKKYKKYILGSVFILAAILIPAKTTFAATPISVTDINSAYFYFDITGKNLTGEFPKNGTKIVFNGTPVINQQRRYITSTGVDSFCKGNTPDSKFQVLAGDSGIPGIVVEFTSLSPVVTAKLTDIDLWGLDPTNGCVQTVITRPMILNDKTRQQTVQYDPTKTGSGTSAPVGKTAIDSIKNTDIKFKDAANIIVTISGTEHTYVDSRPEDTTFKYTNKDGGCSNAIDFASNTDFNSGKLTAQLNIKYADNAVNTCVEYKRTVADVPNTDKAASKLFAWQGNTMQSVGGGSLTLKQLTDSDKTHFVKDPNATDSCAGGWEVILDTASGNTGTFYQFNGSTVLSECVKTATQKRVVLIDGTYSATGTVNNTDTSSSCESSYKGAAFEFNWISCAILRGLDSIIGTIYSQVEGQLFFCTGASATSSSTCSGNLLPDSVKNLWSIFRNLTSGLLVIIMLIMVLSQSFGNGILDAYTVKKVLPRLVIAALLMQLSWYIFKWFIDVSNDLGRGIGDLMYYPFGGPGQFDLDNLIGGAGSWAPNLTITSAGLTVGMLVAFAGFTPFGFILLGLGVVVSVLIGLFVLLFRQILIILCMILAPLALVAWVLPGTNKYYKIWQDNFIKLLMMFPMIVAMIAAGRIFALIGSDAHGGFIGMIIILLGVFGPLFYLPKTFKWGGTAFGALANGIWNGTKKARDWAPTKANEAFKANREQRASDRNQRLAEGIGRSGRPYLDRFLAGKYNYALIGHSREHRFAHNKAAGRKAGEEAAVEAIVGTKYENMGHGDKINTLKILAQGQVDDETKINGQDPIIQRWALDELAKYGDWQIISDLRQQNAIKPEVWEKFVAKNISGIHQNMPHLSPQRKDLTMIGAEDIGGMKDYAIAELSNQIRNGYTRDLNGAQETIADPIERRAQLERGLSLVTTALDDYQIMRRISPAGKAELEAAQAEAREKLLETQTVARPTIDPRTRQVTSVDLPADMSQPAAQTSLTSILLGAKANANPQNYNAIRRSIVTKVIDSNVGSTDEQQFIQYMHGLEHQAQTSPQAKTLYNDLVQEFNDRLFTLEDEAEGQSLSVGHGPTQIEFSVREAKNKARDKSNSVSSQIHPIP